MEERWSGLSVLFTVHFLKEQKWGAYHTRNIFIGGFLRSGVPNVV